MKITIFTDYFPPERNAPANRIYNFSKLWIRNGHDVTVITSFPNSPNGKIFEGYKKPALYKREIMDGIVVKRVWTYMAPNSGFFRRSLDHLSYAITGTLCGLFQKKQDLILATSPQFFTGFCGLIVAKLRCTKWIFEVRDLWPEGMIVINRNSFIYKFLERCEKFFYKKADKIVVVTSSYRENIIKRCGIPRHKISIIYNGSSYCFSENQFEIKKNSEKVIVGYAGTLGVSQGFEFIVTQIHSLKNKPFHFIFVGDGAKREFLNKKKKELNLFNLDIINPLSRDGVSELVKSFDIGLVPLRKFDAYKKVIPSKIFDLAASQVPILLGVEGESASLLKVYRVGETYMPEDADSFYHALEKMSMQIKENENYYNDGLIKLSKDFSHKKLAQQYEEIWGAI